MIKAKGEYNGDPIKLQTKVGNKLYIVTQGRNYKYHIYLNGEEVANCDDLTEYIKKYKLWGNYVL